MTLPNSKITNLAKSLAAVALIAVVAISIAPHGHSYSNADSGIDDHNGNPVIGSLPIKFYAELSDMYPAFRSGLGGSFSLPYSVMTLQSSTTLADDIITAAGQPYAIVDSAITPTSIGLVRDGLLIAHRSRLSQRQAVVKQWLTDEFVGGNLIVDTNAGVFNIPITGNSVELPLRQILNQTDLIIYADITIEPNPNSTNGPLNIVVSTGGNMVTIIYTAQ
ncbi:MAG: hypothetical protein H8E25_07710 [Planctomycetes bacterium]|nr:hypothetical protein [Planctomycetota bacterium]